MAKTNKTEKIFIEYGLDFDNNRYGFGKSTEVENADGTEYRTKNKIKIKTQRHYFRLWVFKKVLVISGSRVKVQTKKRNNFKIVFGKQGTRKN